MTRSVRNEPDERRYAIYVDDELAGFTEYRIRGDDIVFTHTEVNPSRQERGLATELVRAALDDVRATTDHRLVAQCPFVAAFLKKNPDYQDLTTRETAERPAQH